MPDHDERVCEHGAIATLCLTCARGAARRAGLGEVVHMLSAPDAALNTAILAAAEALAETLLTIRRSTSDTAGQLGELQALARRVLALIHAAR